MSQYEVWLCTDRGRRLMPLNNLQELTAAKSLNKTVGFTATLKRPSDIKTIQNYHKIENGIRRDWQVQIWRKDRGPSRLWQAYFVLKWGWAAGDDGGDVFRIGGYDINHLLTRRVVAAYAEETQSTMNDHADDIMKAVVTDSMQDDADPTPDYGTRAWGDLTVAQDLGKAPTIDIAFAWDKLLTVSGRGALPQIANASRAAGNELYFGIFPKSITGKAITWRFATFIDCFRDLTGSHGLTRAGGEGRQVVFDADAGELSNWSLEYDYSEAENYIYAGGQGEADARYVEQVYDETRYKVSYWGRTEGFYDVRNVSDDQVEASANARLIKRRPRIELTGQPVAKPGKVYGRHYEVGDKIIAKAKGHQFTAIVQSAVVQLLPDGKTTESVRLQYRD